MNRRSFLGGCAVAGAASLSGCLDAVAGRLARTEARPAFLLPPLRGRSPSGEAWTARTTHVLRPLDVDLPSGVPGGGSVHVRGWLAGAQLRANNHNTTRSNRYTPSRGPGGGGDGGGGDGGDGSGRANNHNTTRSNRTELVADETDGSDAAVDLARAFDYLDADADGDGIDDADAEDGVVLGETFVVSVPALDLPGVDDPSARADHADYVTNMTSGLREASPTDEETVLRDLTTPTLVAEVDKCSPKIYEACALPVDLYASSPADGTATLEGETFEQEFGPVQGSRHRVARAVATLEGGVTLPVLLFVQHLVHADDHLFVAGWVVDDARLYTNAATVLVAGRETPVHALAPEQAVRASRGEAPISVEDLVVDERETASLVYDDGYHRPDPEADAGLLCGPERCPADSERGLFDSIVRAAVRPDPETAPADPGEPVGLLAVPLDAPLVHLTVGDLSGAVSEDVVASVPHTDSWEA